MRVENPNQPEHQPDVIRYPAAFSRWPVQLLSRERTDRILISKVRPGIDPDTARKTANNRKKQKANESLVHYEDYWEVSANKKHGDPGPGSYNIETLVIFKRADELRQATGSVPELMHIGSLREIARAVGKNPRDTATIKVDLLKGSSAYIDFRIPIQFGKKTEDVEGHNNRYGVFFRGERLPDGSKAEGVYIAWNFPFSRIVNEATTRPLNYELLQELTPLDRRCYEILNSPFYWSWRQGRDYEPVRYSDFCEQSWIKRHMNLHDARMQITRQTRQLRSEKWMGPTIDYETTTDHQGRDWIMRFEIGAEAKAWFKNRAVGAAKPPSAQKPQNGPIARDVRSDGTTDQKQRKNAPRARTARNSAPSDPTSSAYQLALRWFESRHGLEDKEPTATHLEKAAAILAAAGNFEAAVAAIDEAATLGRKNARESEDGRGYPDDLGGVLNGTFVEEAKQQIARQQQADEARQQRKAREEAVAKEREAVRRQADLDYDALSEEQHAELVAATRADLREFISRSPGHWTDEKIEQQTRTKFHSAAWKRHTGRP